MRTDPDQTTLQSSLTRLFSHLSPARRRQFSFVLLLMLLGAAAELATIGAVVPFLAGLSGGSGGSHAPATFMPSASTHSQQLVAATATFAVIAIVAGLIRLQLTWSSQNFVFQVGHDLGVDIQRRILAQPYSYHIGQHTSALVASLEKIQLLVFGLLLPLMQAASATFLGLFIVAALISIDPFTAIVAALSFCLIYLFISAITRDRLRQNSAAEGASFDQRVQIIQESLGGIRDVIIDGTQSRFLEQFRQVDGRLNRARATTAFIGAAPRFVIEALGMVMIALLAYVLVQRPGGIAAAIPALGALALGAQRLLPLVQQVYNGWTLAVGHNAVIVQVLDLLSLPAPQERASPPAQPLPFDNAITLEQVSFVYPGRRDAALSEVSLTIPRGTTLGLIGRSGSGKSTLADILMGLLEPEEGRIMIDGVPLDGASRPRWWRSIAHVPQAVFLSDQSIARNIAFGAPAKDVDMAKVAEACGKAQLHDFIASLPGGYDTLVGERGVRLSGGQRQRLGLARAIYKAAPVLILDEATSALDHATEAEVMREVAGLAHEGRTVIVIAHRASTIAYCDLVAELDHGGLVRCTAPDRTPTSGVSKQSRQRG